MYLAIFSVVVLLLPVCAHAEAVYAIRPLSEREVVNTYDAMLIDVCRNANGEWHEWKADPTGGYWGDGVSAGNQGIRAVANLVLASDTVLKYSKSLKAQERKEFLRKSIAALKYIVSTHKTGKQKCVDGKQWGADWQSGMWAGTLAMGAWLIWDELPPDVRKDVERVVTSEADRFLTIKIPSGRWGDTKAEENAWDLTTISAAANMFPTHPHAAAWNVKAIEYMMNTLSVPQDRSDETLVDGRPVREWVCTENLHPDFTLENHNIFHPSYVQCSSYMLTEVAMQYAYAKKPIPQAATHHVMDVWNMFQTILLPSGETTYPQGQDWELHGLNPINLFASLGTYMKDPLAADLERINLQYMRAWQQMCKGSLAPPGSGLGFTRDTVQAEQATWSFLAHKLFGPAVDAPAPPLPHVTENYSLVGVALHSTPQKHFTFSWKYRVMGVLTPRAAGHEANPFFTVPITNGFIGTIDLEANGNKHLAVVDRSFKKTPDGFETTGVVDTDGGLLKQAISVTSMGDKTVVYQDRVTAVSDVTVTRELGAPVGIENDLVSGGERIVYHDGGKTTFDWQKTQPMAALPGKWANADGRLGVVAAAGSGLAYVQAAAYNPQGVYADMLCGSSSVEKRAFKAGAEVAHRVVIYCVEITPEQTAALARSVKIEDKELRFQLPEGGEAQVSLL